MRTIPMLCVIVACSLAVANGGATIAADDSEKCDEHLRSFLQDYMARPQSVGISIGLIHDGKESFYNAGSTNASNNHLPTENTSYEIGSISKTFTGTLLAEAVTKNLLGLDDDVRKFMPGTYPNLEFKGEAIRVKHLLNHTSGLPYHLPFAQDDFKEMSPQKAARLKEVLEKYSKEQLLADLHNVKLDGVPGKNLSYSNTAAQLMGLILETVCGQTFDTLLKQFTASHQMKHTGVGADSKSTSYAVGYNGDREEMPTAPSLEGPAGSLRSTAADMLKYAQLQMNDDDPCVRLCHQPTWGDIQYYAIGLNWQMERREKQPYRIWQSGSTGGYTSLIQVYPDASFGIVILTNESSENSQHTLSKLANSIYVSCVDLQLEN